MELVETFKFEQNLFEAASALGTVGLSTGITPSLSLLGKLVVTLLMFSGRLGPLTFGIALFFAGPSKAGGQADDLAVWRSSCLPTSQSCAGWPHRPRPSRFGPCRPRLFG